MLTFSFTGADGTMVHPELLTSGMVGKPIQFLFSEEWEGLNKTAVYIAGDRCVVRPGLDERDVIPAEVLEDPLQTLWVGVYGISNDMECVIPTIRAEGPKILPGVDPNGDPALDPTLPVWARLQTLVGNPETLLTREKDSLVEAINELYVSGGAGSGTAELPNAFAGRTASFYGDSLTEVNYHYTKGYHQWISEILKLSKYHNYGKSGSRISDVLSQVNAVSDTAELVIVMCGVNDQTYSVPLGALGDSTTSTTYGAVKLLCQALKNKYPTSVVVFVTPHYQTKYPHSAGITSAEVSKAIREVCAGYAIPVYDNYSLCGIYETNLDVYTTDSCHWNDAAHEMVGRNLALYLRSTFAHVPARTEEVILTGIEAVFNQGSTVVTPGDSLESLKSHLTITAHYSDGSTKPVILYTLSGELKAPNCTITASYGGQTATFNVQVYTPEDIPEVVLTSIDAQFNQGSAVVTPGDSLESLRPYLTVTAHYSDGSTKPVTLCTLTGELQAPSSVITVTWGGKTDTFTVQVWEPEDIPEVVLSSIDAQFNQGSAVVTPGDSLESLRPYLTVTAHYSDGSTKPVALCTLTGELQAPNSVITVSWGGKTDTFSVTVTAPEADLVTVKSINAQFLQEGHVILDTASLEDLRQYLTVTATYSDNSVREEADYSLNGTLTPGSSTITVSFLGKTTSFTVTVTEYIPVEKTLEITGSKFSQQWHVSLYVPTGDLPNISGDVTWGFDIRPITNLVPSAKSETGGIYTVNTINSLLAGFTEATTLYKKPTITDNENGTYTLQFTKTCNITADRNYWCFPANLVLSPGDKIVLVDPYVRVGTEICPIHAIGGAFEEETCIVS